MARIEGVPAGRGGLIVRFAYWFMRRRYGRVLGPGAVMAHQPHILQAAGAYEFMFERAHRVDKRLKQLASLKAAALIGCVF